METRKKRRVKRIVFAVFVLLVAGALTALPFILNERQESLGQKASILTTQVTRGSIQKTLSGTGTLSEQEAQSVTVPGDVKVTAYLVANGQTVQEGDAVAKVDRVSVMKTISDVQDAMDETAAELEDAGERSYSYIEAPAPGRVKAVYIQTGDSVLEVMEQYGALVVLSLDGLMAVDIPADPALSIGQSLVVTLSDDSEHPGRVELVNNGAATVTFSDQFGTIGETARVSAQDGTDLGSGEVYVHSAWKAMASAGTAYTVFATMNAEYWTGGTVLSIRGASDGGYEALLAEYRAYEETMAELFRLYQDGVLRAPCDGVVSGVDETLIEPLADTGTGMKIELLANAPTGDPNAVYLNRIGMLSAVNSDGSASFLMQTWDTEIPDYTDLAFVVTAPESMTKKTALQPQATSLQQTGIAAYRWDGQRWTEMTSLARGDVFAFACDATGGEPVWMVYVGHNDLPEPTPETPSQGTPGTPGGTGGMPSISGGTGRTSLSGFSGVTGSGYPSSQSQQVKTRYEVGEKTVLSVTPQESVTVSMTVDELDILSLHLGAEAAVTLDALPGQSFTGHIREVSKTASNEGGHSKYSAVVELPRTDSMLGGMNASVRITVESREDILTLPAEALIELDGRSAVYTAYDPKTETLLAPVPVETGLSDGLTVQIVSGLTEGIPVWYAFYDTLEISGLS